LPGRAHAEGVSGIPRHPLGFNHTPLEHHGLRKAIAKLGRARRIRSQFDGPVSTGPGNMDESASLALL
jgi:hypothetical protein